MKPVSKTVSVSEAREQLSSFVRWSNTNQDYVIIKVRGRAEAVLIPYDDLEVLEAAREAERRRQALATLEALAAEVSSRNQELTDAEVDEIAEEISRDAVQGLVDSGKIKFND